jgi:hypothetical protein
LQDVIYYKQIKDFSDAEYESSRDLKKAIEKGKLTKLEGSSALRGSSDFAPAAPGAGIGLDELRIAIREAMPGVQAPADLRGIARELAPIVADIVHQEMSRLPLSASTVSTARDTVSAFQGPEYVPTVTTEGMTSNVEATATKVSGTEANDAISALRKLQGLT